MGIKLMSMENLSQTTKKVTFSSRMSKVLKNLSRSSTIQTPLALVKDHLKLISGSQRLTFKSQTMRSLSKTSFNSLIFKRLKTGISTKCNKCNQCNRTKEAIFIKIWAMEIEVESTTIEAIEVATEVVEVEAETRTTKAVRTLTKDRTKVTITIRDKTCLNLHKLRDK